MKIIQESPFIVGKIKVWHNPFYRIEDFGPNRNEIKEILEDELNCKTDMPYYKKPHPNTVLGKKHPTFRFEFITLLDEGLNGIVEHLNLGFGQNGYYYDIIICDRDFNGEIWEDFFMKIKQIISLIEKTLETKFPDFNYSKNHQNHLNWEISNLDLTFDDNDNLINNNFPELKILTKKIKERQEYISKDHENLIFPEINLNIDSNFRFSNPILFQRSEKYLEDERRLVLRLVPPNENTWNISSRGIPFDILIDYIKELFHKK